MDPKVVTDPGQDRLMTELWAWIVVDPQTQLEGICGYILDGCPRLAITASKEEALRLCEIVLAAKASSQKTFRLVRYEKQKAEMEI